MFISITLTKDNRFSQKKSLTLRKIYTNLQRLPYMGGFFGTALRRDCVTDLFYGTDYNSHLGTKRGGMATYDSERGFVRSIHSLENTYFRTKFESVLPRFKGQLGIGIISDNDSQPIVVNSHLGKFAIVTVAKIQNIAEIERQMLDAHIHFAETSSGATNPTEMVAALINEGDNFADGIRYAQLRIQGSCSMLLLTTDGLIAARDRLGRTPIVIGKGPDGYAVTSETTAFPNLGYEVVRDLGPGEILRITAEGVEVLKEALPEMQICSFLWVYYGFPVSSYEGINVDEVRYRSGELMGEKDDTEIECVCGIPDSGVGMAMGFAAGKGIPYRRCVAKYTPTWPRSFTPSNQSMRDLVAKMKLIPNAAMLKDRKVAFCDDSIVRGTQLKDNVHTFYEYGAKEVHMRIACPPLIYGCPFIGFTSSKSDMELITRRIISELEGDPNKNLEAYATTDSPEYKALVQKIAERFGLTSLKFSKLEDLIKAIGLPKCKVCTHCFDGSSHF